MLAHPGKKLLFMGQDFAQYDEWAEDRSLEWELLQYDEHKQMQNYVKALNTFYKEHPALYEMDYDPDGFTWINNISANENMVVFTRNTKKKDETLLLQNAELTAEAALPLLLEQLSCPLAGSRILLCGFGRIGKLLARKLRVLGADVTVSARKAQDLELARILGFRRIKTGNWAGALAQYDGIVNTVPAPVVIPEHLQSIRKDCALLELASLPGGFCTEAQALPGYLAARGLPGQYAPESAAAIIRSAIFRSLNQEEAS